MQFFSVKIQFFYSMHIPAVADASDSQRPIYGYFYGLSVVRRLSTQYDTFINVYQCESIYTCAVEHKDFRCSHVNTIMSTGNLPSLEKPESDRSFPRRPLSRLSFPSVFSPLGLFPVGLFPARSFPR